LYRKQPFLFSHQSFVFTLSLEDSHSKIKEKKRAATNCLSLGITETCSLAENTHYRVMASLKLWTSLLGMLMLLPASIHAFDYNITSAGKIVLFDVATGIPGLKTIFTGDTTSVSVDGVEWEASGVEDGDNFVTFTTSLNGNVVEVGRISLAGVGRTLPTSFQVGNIIVPKSK
jgi:hypothetical protein